MNTRLRCATVALIFGGTLLTGSSTALAASPGDARAEATVYGGGFHFNSGGGNHATVGGSLALNANEYVQLFGEFNYTPTGSTNFSVGGISGSVSSKLMNFGGGVLANFASKGSKAVPYAVGVVGDGRFSSSASGAAAGSSASFSASSNNVYAGAGAGIRLFAGDSWGFRPEFRYQRYLQNGGTNTLMFTVGLFYGFAK